MKKTTLAIITVLLLLCMCLPVGFEQPPVVNDITSQTSARNDDTNQQPGENQTATDLCQDLPPEHETTEGVWICDPDGKLVDAEGNVIRWQWHGDELPITPVECDEKPTEKQLAGTNFASALNKGFDVQISHMGGTSPYDVFLYRIGSAKPQVHGGSEDNNQSGFRVEYEMRYVDNVTEETSVTNNISGEFIIFPERVEISSPGSNQDHGGSIVITVDNGGIGGAAEDDKLVAIEIILGSAANDTFAPQDGDSNTIDGGSDISSGSNQDHGGSIVITVDNGGIGGAAESDKIVTIEIILGSAANDTFAPQDGDSNTIDGGSDTSSEEEHPQDGDSNTIDGGSDISSEEGDKVTEMRFIFDAVEDNSTTDNQTLDGIEYELTEINIIERKGCTLSVPELAPSFDDEDADGVIDAWDDCENTTAGVATDSKGCDVKAVIDANNTPGFTLIAVLTMSVGAAMLLGRQRIYD